jgi:membrane-bound serine protease (ClpP class)
MEQQNPSDAVGCAAYTLPMRFAGACFVGLALLSLAAWAGGDEVLPAGRSGLPVLSVQIDGAIGPASADHLHRALASAVRQRAQLLVLRIDTPGGLDASMRSIIRDILASPVPVATYVAPNGARAASAGTYILYASHFAAMAPASNLGAATPVAISLPMPGGEPEHPAPTRKASDAQAPSPDTMTAKRVGDAAAYIRSLAQLRGRNVEWAERAVREAVSLSANEALAIKVVDLVASDLPDLLRQLDGREVKTSGGTVRLATQGAAVVDIEADWRTRVLSVITEPSLALILMMVGIYGLLFEFSNPGFVLPGVVGAICLLLGLFALQMLPVNYAGLGLILLGLALLVAEAFLPSFGVVGLGGVAAFVIGAVLLFDSETPGFGIPPLLIGLLAAISAAFVLVVAATAVKARRRPLVSGVSTLTGMTGQLIEYSGDTGWALVEGEHWRVRGSGPLQPGARVCVVRVLGRTLEVAVAGDASMKGA